MKNHKSFNYRAFIHKLLCHAIKKTLGFIFLAILFTVYLLSTEVYKVKSTKKKVPWSLVHNSL